MKALATQAAALDREDDHRVVANNLVDRALYECLHTNSEPYALWVEHYQVDVESDEQIVDTETWRAELGTQDITLGSYCRHPEAALFVVIGIVLQNQHSGPLLNMSLRLRVAEYYASHQTQFDFPESMVENLMAADHAVSVCMLQLVSDALNIKLTVVSNASFLDGKVYRSRRSRFNAIPVYVGIQVVKDGNGGWVANYYSVLRRGELNASSMYLKVIRLLDHTGLPAGSQRLESQMRLANLDGEMGDLARAAIELNPSSDSDDDSVGSGSLSQLDVDSTLSQESSELGEGDADGNRPSLYESPCSNHTLGCRNLCTRQYQCQVCSRRLCNSCYVIVGASDNVITCFDCGDYSADVAMKIRRASPPAPTKRRRVRNPKYS